MSEETWTCAGCDTKISVKQIHCWNKLSGSRGELKCPNYDERIEKPADRAENGEER